MDIGKAMVRLRVFRSEEEDAERIMALRKMLLEKRLPTARPRPSLVFLLREKWRGRH
jgi:hypothetical protein